MTTLADKVKKIDDAIAAKTLEKEQRDTLVLAVADPTFDLNGVLARLEDVDALEKAASLTPELAKAMREKILAPMVAATATDPVALLTAVIEKKELARLQPWRAQLETYQRQWAAIHDETLETHRNLFDNAARNGTMSPYGMLILSYLLYGEDGDRHQLAGMLLRDPEHVLQSHNWSVAHKIGATFLDVHGSKLETLEYPLFPDAKQFSAINDRVMQEVGIHPSMVTGGGPGFGPKKRKCSAFRSGLSVLQATAGDPWLPVTVEADGSAWVDGASINEIFTTERERVDALSAEIRSIQSDLRHQQQLLQQARQHQAPTGGQGTAATTAASGAKGRDKPPLPPLEESVALVLKKVNAMQKRLDRNERYESLKKKIEADLKRQHRGRAKAGEDDDDSNPLRVF